jgi:RNA polymerase sigma-70 factor (ECF subfamily)
VEPRVVWNEPETCAPPLAALPELDIGHARGAPGDTAAEALLAREYPYVVRTLKRRGVKGTDCDDLAQEVLLVAWRRWSDFDGARPLRPWLVGIAVRVARYYRREKLRQLDTPEAVPELADDKPSAESDVASARDRALVMVALEQLAPKHRALIVRHDLDGCSIAELASELALPRFTLYTRLRAARIQFAKIVRRLLTFPPQVFLQARGPSTRVTATRVLSRHRVPRPEGRARAQHRSLP